MKPSKYLLGSVVLLSSLALCGQQTNPSTNPNSPSGRPPYATPPTFPESSNPSQPNRNMPPDQSAPVGAQSGTRSSNATGDTQLTIKGCLTQVGGGFSIADETSGKSYVLRGDNDQLAKHAGEQVAISGMSGDQKQGMSADQNQPSTANQQTPPSASAEAAQTSSSATEPLTVQTITKIADTCPAQR